VLRPISAVLGEEEVAAGLEWRRGGGGFRDLRLSGRGKLFYTGLLKSFVPEFPILPLLRV